MASWWNVAAFSLSLERNKQDALCLLFPSLLLEFLEPSGQTGESLERCVIQPGIETDS